MTTFPPDDMLESLYKLRIRESEQLRTVLKLCQMEIRQKKAERDHRRLKTMVKRSPTSQSRIRGNSVVFQEDQETVGSGKVTGSVRKETHAVSGTIRISVQNQRSTMMRSSPSNLRPISDTCFHYSFHNSPLQRFSSSLVCSSLASFHLIFAQHILLTLPLLPISTFIRLVLLEQLPPGSLRGNSVQLHFLLH